MADQEFHVAPWGDDAWPGTAERPFATPRAARRAVRGRPAGTAGAVVSFRAGVYPLSEPLELGADQRDSGIAGDPVVFRAYGHGTAEQETAVLSGGRPVTGWQPFGAPSGAWRAEVGALETRQLYVGGRRAPRAAVSPGIPGNVTKTATGFVTDSVVPGSWHDPASVEFVFRGVNPWTEARCGVASITADASGSTITMAQPAFARALELYAADFGGTAVAESDDEHWGVLRPPTSAENSVSFLTEPGTWALDRSRPGAHLLCYLPLPGEDPAEAEFVVPVLERLLVVAGTPDRPAHDIAVRGLTFAHAGWTAPSGPDGFPHFHGNTYHDGGPVRRVELAEGLAHIAVPERPALVPAAVVVADAARITLADNTFTRLGAGALALAGPGGEHEVCGNEIGDVSGGGIAVDGGADIRVEHNLVHDVGREYHGSPAVWVAESRRVTVARNVVRDVPYSGVVVMGGERTERVHVVENLVERTMAVLADGGGVYLAGRQGDSWESGALVAGNVIRDTLTPYNFALYTDYGSTWVTACDNAVYRADNVAILRVTPPLAHVAYRANRWDGEPVGHDAPPAGVTLDGNTVLSADDPEGDLVADPAGAAILRGVATAGPQRPRGKGTGPA